MMRGRSVRAILGVFFLVRLLNEVFFHRLDEEFTGVIDAEVLNG